MKIFYVSMLMLISFLPIQAQETNPLSKPYNITTGDWFSYRLSEMIRINPDLSALTLVSYDKEQDLIIVTIYGGRNAIEGIRSSRNQKAEGGAKESLLKWCEYIESIYITRIEKDYEVKLKAEDFIVIYIYQKTGKEIIRMEKGQLVLPK